MTSTLVPLNIEQNNASVPYFASMTWNYENSDILVTPAAVANLDSRLTFSYIQAFYNSGLTSTPTLAIWSGKRRPDGSLILNEVQFAFSGDRVQIKGIAIMSTGTDIRDKTVSSLAINPASPTNSFSKVKGWGGMY